jgi:hypothetical protein
VESESESWRVELTGSSSSSGLDIYVQTVSRSIGGSASREDAREILDDGRNVLRGLCLVIYDLPMPAKAAVTQSSTTAHFPP